MVNTVADCFFRPGGDKTGPEKDSTKSKYGGKSNFVKLKPVSRSLLCMKGSISNFELHIWVPQFNVSQ